MITNATYISALPSNLIYFTQIRTLPPPPYDVTIEAHCITEAADVNVAIFLDGSPTSYTTPHTFRGLNGTHTFTVPDSDTNGDPFEQWSTGRTDRTIAVSSAETFTAFYGRSPVHDVAVNNVVLSKTVVGQNCSLDVNVTVGNLGDYPETFNLILYANTTAIGDIAIINLSNGTFSLVIFACNTTGFAYGNYSLSAYAPPVSGETNTANNNFTGWIYVGLVGDVSGNITSVPDGKVDMRDIAYVAKLFGTNPSSPLWDTNADINSDGRIDMVDLGTVAKHFLEHLP
jgi:hypothetical protein